jgi:hypothetical protein
MPDGIEGTSSDNLHWTPSGGRQGTVAAGLLSGCMVLWVLTLVVLAVLFVLLVTGVLP